MNKDNNLDEGTNIETERGSVMVFKLCIRCRCVPAYHISMGVEYSVDPRSTSGGRYHNVTTSLE